MRTVDGRDHQVAVCFDPAANGTGAFSSAYFMGVTANTDAPVETDTSLAGEIITGTLARGACSLVHTAGSAALTLIRTVTSDQVVVLAKVGIFNAITGGSLCYETMLDATYGLVVDDEIAISEVINV